MFKRPFQVPSQQSSVTSSYRKSLFAVALLAFGLFPLFCLGTTYYASPNGSSGNSGLSTSSPWSFSYAISHAGVSNTIIVMDGLYSGEQDIGIPWGTIKAQNKWKAIFANSGGPGIALYPSGNPGMTLDGLVVSNAHQHGILLYNPNCTIRNCWITQSGQNNAGAQAGSGIFDNDGQFNTLVECNLIELNGSDPTFDHGMYLSGTNLVIRNNVIRKNVAYGIQIYGGGNSSSGIKIYNN